MNIWELLVELELISVNRYLKVEVQGLDSMLLDDKDKLAFGLKLIELGTEVLSSVKYE